MRGAYGLLGQEMIGWLTHLQHTPDKNVWLVGLLDRMSDRQPSKCSRTGSDR